MKYIQLMLLFWVGCAAAVLAQNITVKGTVLANDKEPLIGVSVVQVGNPSNGASTDFDGNYTLSVPANARIQFSYIGFKTMEKPVNNQTTINVEMELEAHGLQEIVFLGYSGQKKAELSSSVVSIDGSKLKDVTTSDVGGMLQGRVAGMQVSHASGQPGNATGIRIRGAGSINASAAPLYVVDGIPGGNFNPNDIEMVTVLKDAAGTALYGSDGSGGVIVITTKKAKHNQPTTIQFKATYGRNEAVKGRLRMMDGAELYDTHRNFYTSQEAMEKVLPSYLRDTSYDWHKASFDAGSTQDYYLSVGGASNETTYMISANYFKQDGTLINTGYDKISTRLSLGTKLYKNVDLNVRLNYERADKDQTSSYTTGEGAYRNMPWDVPHDADFNIIKVAGGERPDNGLPWYTQDKRNFLHSEQYNFANNKSSQLGADAQLNWNILDWLMFTSNNRFSSGEYTYSRFIDSRTADPSNAYGYYGQNIGKHSSWMSSNLLRMNKEFGIHTLSAIVGFETGRSTNRYTSAHVRGTEKDPMIPGKATLHGSTFDPNETDSYNYKSMSWSAFGQVQYNLLDRYFLTGSMRLDASSVFAKNHRKGYFPSVSGAWIITNENFMPKNDVLSFLKLRLSHGVTGNSSEIPRFASLTRYEIVDGSGLHLLETANKDLKWQSAHMSTIGLDFRFFDRLDLNVDIYNTDNKDVIRWVDKSHASGSEKVLENAGGIRNRGIEIQLSSDNIVTKDFYWNTTFNIAFNRNKMKDLEAPTVNSIGTSLIQRLENGLDNNSWYGRKWMGVDYENGDPLWERIEYDQDGKETNRYATNNYEDATDQVVGRATPDFTGGFTNSLKYKGIGLDVSGSFVYGNDVYNRDREYLDTDGAYQLYNMMSLRNNWSRWEKPGDVATHPRLVPNGNRESNKHSSRYLEDGSFFRLKNITLSYELPTSWISKARMKSCRLFVSADNILTITRFSGIDPEVSLEGSLYSLSGMYSYHYPISRQILFGVDIKF